MNDLDDRIKEALKDSGDSEEILKDRGMLAEVLTPFRGKRRWVNFAGIAYGIIANIVTFWSAYRFYVAEEVRDQLLWGGLCVFALLAVVFSKVYFWMEMHTNRVLREVKRVELLVHAQSKTDSED